MAHTSADLVVPPSFRTSRVRPPANPVVPAQQCVDLVAHATRADLAAQWDPADLATTIHLVFSVQELVSTIIYRNT